MSIFGDGTWADFPTVRTRNKLGNQSFRKAGNRISMGNVSHPLNGMWLTRNGWGGKGTAKGIKDVRKYGLEKCGVEARGKDECGKN